MKAFNAIVVLLVIGLANAEQSLTFNPSSTHPHESTTTPEPSSSTVNPVPPPGPAPEPIPVSTEDIVTFQLKNNNQVDLLGSFQGKLQLAAQEAKQNFDITLNNLTLVDESGSSVTKSKIVLSLFVNGEKDKVLSFTFNLDNETYSLTLVNFTYPAAKEQASGSWNGSLFNISKEHSYLCNSAQTLALKTSTKDKLTFDLKNFKVDAFRNSSTTVYREATECEADIAKSDFVPFAVGAALVALVVIVLIAFLIGRKRSRRLAYESV